MSPLLTLRVVRKVLSEWGITPRKWPIRIGMAAVFAAALAYVPYRVVDGTETMKVDRMEAQLEQMREQTQALRGSNRQLRQQISALKYDIGAIEDIARNELGFVRDGEIIIRVRERRQ